MSDYTFEQFSAIRRYQPQPTFSPDGSEIAYIVNTSGQFNLWRQSSERRFPRQLTLFSNQRCPRNRLVTRRFRRLPLRPTATATSSSRFSRFPRRGGRVTAADRRAECPPRDCRRIPGRRMVPPCLCRQRPQRGRSVDVMVRTLATGEVRRPVDYGGFFFPMGWAPDGKSLTV